MLLFFLATCSALVVSAQSTSYNERAAAYIQQYKDWAIAEQQRSGVPAAITLAQGVHETNAGMSELATNANNHFGIKCKKEWTGETYSYTDDAPNECFRKYKSARESYRDHSDYLHKGTRYASCFALDVRDYKGWARELKRCGYATNRAYTQKLIKIIEDFHLQDYTLAALNQAPAANTMVASAASPVAGAMMADPQASPDAAPADTPAAPTHNYGKLVKKDGARGFWARKGDVLLEYAIQFKVRYAKLLEINGLPDAPLSEDRFIYIERGGSLNRIVSKDPSSPAEQTQPTPAAATPSTAETATATAPVATTPQSDSIAAEVPADTAVEKPAIQTAAATTSAPAPGQPMNAAQAAAASEARLFGEAKPASQATAPTTTKDQAVRAPAADAKAPAGIAKPFNIANEKAVEEQPEQPQDEFSKLKNRLDKVVFAQADTTSAAPPTTSPAPAAAVPEVPQFHTVQSGETAFGIAKKYGITMQQLMEWNQLSFGTDIKVGQKLRVK